MGSPWVRFLKHHGNPWRFLGGRMVDSKNRLDLKKLDSTSLLPSHDQWCMPFWKLSTSSDYDIDYAYANFNWNCFPPALALSCRPSPRLNHRQILRWRKVCAIAGWDPVDDDNEATGRVRIIALISYMFFLHVCMLWWSVHHDLLKQTIGHSRG